MMKNLICMALLMLCFVSTILAQKEDKGITFSAVNTEGQTLYYQVLSNTDKTVALVKNKKDKYRDEKYIIPDKVSYNEYIYTVIEIGVRAFSNTKIKEIVFPNTIKKIGKRSFSICTKLTNIVFPNSLAKIETSAFDMCSNLEALKLPDSIESVEIGAFANCPNIRTMHVPASIKHIGVNGLYWERKWPQIIIKYKGYISELPHFITTANCKTYGLSEEAVSAYQAERLAKQQSTANPQIVYAQSGSTELPNSEGTKNTNIKLNIPSSDVDINIPTNSINNEKTFAIIIANENYQEESQVSYAINDGEMFKQYCNKVLGLPEENIHFRKDATLNNIQTEINWLINVSKAYNGEAKLIIYYAGHGIPDEASGSAYLLPIDGKGNLLSTGYSLANLYKTLGELPAKNVTVFMDACFSGAQRNGKMLASARGVAIKAKPEVPKGEMVVFSAAQGDETAYPYNDKEHGLFTYYLLKKLQESKGDVSFQELAEYIKLQVSRKSIVANGKSQTPSMVYSTNLGESWKTMKLK